MKRAYARRTSSDPPPSAPRVKPLVASPKVYWSARHRVFFRKYKRDGAWKNKVVPVSFDTEERAAEWFAAWRRKFEETGVEPTNDEVMAEETKTVRTLADRWLAWKKEQFGVDIRNYKGCKRLLDKWVLPHAIADVDIEKDLDLGHCTGWVEWVKKFGRAPNTVRNVVQGLRGFFVDVRGKGWVRLKENPLLDPFIRKMLNGCEPVAGRNTIIHLKKEETQRLLLCAAPDIPALRKVRNLVAIATGGRLGELGGLRWEDIDLDSAVPTVKIFRQLQGNTREGVPIFKEPKRKSHRILPLHPIAAAALLWWRDKAWREYVGVSPRACDPVFPNSIGEYNLSKWADLLRADLAVAKVPTLFDGKHPITFHALRRTFMSLLEGEGVTRDLIGAFAGHAGKTVTDRHYIAKNIERFHEAVKKLPIPEELPWLPEKK